MQTGGAGLLYSFLAMVLFCGAMYFSAVVLAKEAVERKEDDFNYPSLYGKYLGVWGKWVATVANLLILYGLLTAYLGGGTTIIVSAIGGEGSGAGLSFLVTLLLFVSLSAFTAAGTGFVARYNQLLMLFLAVSFIFLVAMGAGSVHLEQMNFHDLRFLPIALPVMLIALLFPSVFLKAIGVVGGVGIAILFGILPAVIFFLKSKSIGSRILALGFGIVFTVVLVIDLSNDIGIIDTDAILEGLKQEAVLQHKG